MLLLKIFSLSSLSRALYDLLYLSINLENLADIDNFVVDDTVVTAVVAAVVVVVAVPKKYL